MTPASHDVRCQRCSALLAKVDQTGLTIRRSDLQVTLDGEFRATLVCYRPRCRSLNILTLSTRNSRVELAPSG